MRKVQIWTIRGLACANLGYELCVDNLQIGHILAHALFLVWHMCTLIEQWHIIAV